MTVQVLTANRLTNGLVVYFTAGGGWSEAIGEAKTAPKADAKALAAEGERAGDGVVAPYLIDVDTGDGTPRPLRFRERIRAFGPPVHPRFARASAPETEG